MPTAIAIRKIDGKPGQVWYPLDPITTPTSTPGPDQVTVRIHAAALNHRDLFLRQHLYPGTTFGVPLLADGSGTVTRTGANTRSWLHKRVVLNPGTGWASDPAGPESASGYRILGGTKFHPLGTLTDELVIEASELEEAPGHLSSVEAAALPLTGLTAWRATVTKSGACERGRNVLVTGIGGGVALMSLAFAVAAGANVWVTSGSEEKIERAVGLGAKGGVNYKEGDWDRKLMAMLPEDRKFLDAIIDGAGGDVVDRGAKLLKAGGVIVSYGMTIAPKLSYSMGAVLKNIELRGSTMGSRKEFADMIKFVTEKNVRPVVSRVVSGLENLDGIDGLFEDMKSASQFGKLVIEISKDDAQSKL